MLSSLGLIYGPNFSTLSQTVLELSRQKEMLRRKEVMDGWTDKNKGGSEECSWEG